MVTETPEQWEERYRRQDTPWDSGLPSAELLRTLEEESIPPCRAVELGCGTGINAVLLAQRGFEVTAVDCSPLALERARQRAAEAGVAVTFLERDVCNLTAELGPFAFVFDRGCYHCVRQVNLPGFLESLRRITQPGTRYLLLAGNANEQTEHEGPPRVHEHEIREDLGALFDIQRIREFRFEGAGDAEGPLGWSCLLVRSN